MVLKVHRETLSLLDINYLILTFYLPLSPVSAHISVSLPLCLSQSIQHCVAEMLEVLGEPSLVPAIQTATLHLSTVPGLLKSATGKARDAHRSTLLNRERQRVRESSKWYTQHCSSKSTKNTHTHARIFCIKLYYKYKLALFYELLLFLIVYSIVIAHFFYNCQCMYTEKLVENK